MGVARLVPDRVAVQIASGGSIWSTTDFGDPIRVGAYPYPSSFQSPPLFTSFVFPRHLLPASALTVRTVYDHLSSSSSPASTDVGTATTVLHTSDPPRLPPAQQPRASPSPRSGRCPQLHPPPTPRHWSGQSSVTPLNSSTTSRIKSIHQSSTCTPSYAYLHQAAVSNLPLLTTSSHPRLLHPGDQSLLLTIRRLLALYTVDTFPGFQVHHPLIRIGYIRTNILVFCFPITPHRNVAVFRPAPSPLHHFLKAKEPLPSCLLKTALGPIGSGARFSPLALQAH